MAYPSHMARTALRAALRNHPNAASVLAGRLVNTLTKAELDNGLIALGIDPAVVLAALGPAPDQPLPKPSCDNLPQHQDSAPMPETQDKTTQDNAIETEVQTIRSLIVTGGFSALDDRLRELVTEARKPAVEVEVVREVEVEAPASGARPVHVARDTGQVLTWKKLFGVKGALGDRTTAIWDGSHPDTPRLNSRYIWPHPQTEAALSQLARGRNVFLWGPPGTGKTEFALQLAAVTGRPAALISCDSGTDAATLVGMTVPASDGGVTWQDGQLTRAIRTPGCVVIIDEPSLARSGALFVLQNILANRVLFISETGARVPVAPGVLFIACDNTNGTGGGARRGFTDTNRLNAAFLDRFGPRVHFDYMDPAQEANTIAGYTGCTIELAQLLLSAAAVTRAAADTQSLSQGIGLRRLIAWAEMLTDGIDAETAFRCAILDAAPEAEVETLREQCLLAYDRVNVSAALNPSAPVPLDPSVTNPTPAGRAAAADFASV